MAIGGAPSPSPRLRGEGRGEERPRLLKLGGGGKTPHPDLLPASGEKGIGAGRFAP